MAKKIFLRISKRMPSTFFINAKMYLNMKFHICSMIATRADRALKFNKKWCFGLTFWFDPKLIKMQQIK